ncbi:MAG TPA: GNAT family N-acetyltransferase [Cyclobacteriaceae bacterium]
MKNISIEIYTDSYKQPVAELILDIQRNEFGVPITLEQQPDLNSISEFYQKGNGNFWVAIHNKEVIGTIALIDIGNQQIALRKMFVHKDYRGKEFGTGQALLDKAINWMEIKECREVFLGTLEVFVAAQKFYRKNGFVEILKSDLPSEFPAMKLDNTFFKKTIEPQQELKILAYEKQHQPWFESLNRTWIEKYFWMEPIDFEVLQHPDKHIIDKGGEILMVSLNEEVVGTVALKYVQPGVYEFTKMAVDEKFQAKGLGQELAKAAIHKAKKLGATKIILYSNTKLAPAIKLYRRLGFQEVPVDGPYKRSDIKMELSLTIL